MKKMMKRTLAAVTLLAMLATNAFATTTVTEPRVGTGDYYVTVSNDSTTTGVSILGDTFHAFQIFEAADVTSYSVAEDFRNFFMGTTMVSGDGSGTTYDFQTYLAVITTYEGLYGSDDSGASATDTADYEIALNTYNQLAGQYMDSYNNNMYSLAVQIRAFLDEYGAHTVGETGISCMAHATAEDEDGDGIETALIEKLDTGYYFIFDQDSTLDGLGVAASGAFMPLTSTSEFYSTITVKESIPTMVKNILHDDEEKWDIVGDSQIGDTVKFRIIATLPSNIEDYIKDDESNPNGIDQYTYTITDEMSDGLIYDSNVKVYMDAEMLSEVDAQDYLIIDETTEGTAFVLDVDVMKLLEDNPTISTLFIYYSATLGEEAIVANNGYDTNTATLEYSSNPYDAADFGETSSSVTHFTFALDVFKMDESGNGLAGARFGLFDEDGIAVPLSEAYRDLETGVIYYSYDETVPVVSDGGYITTEAVEINGGETVTGQFSIIGLNDQISYTLKEVEAPNGYNTADMIDVFYTVTYDALGVSITHFTDGSAYVYTSQDNSGDWSSSATIINRLKIYLPTTGGMGTVIFQVGGGAMMLAAVAVFAVGQRKKERK